MSIRTNVKTVAIFGAGQMGAGIAQVFAQSGRTVLLQDAAPGVPILPGDVTPPLPHSRPNINGVSNPILMSVAISTRLSAPTRSTINPKASEIRWRPKFRSKTAAPAVETVRAAFGCIDMPVPLQSVRSGTSNAHPQNDTIPPIRQ